MKARRRTGAVIVSVGVALLLSFPPPSAAGDAAAPLPVPGPVAQVVPGTSNLSGVACTSSVACVAVGSRFLGGTSEGAVVSIRNQVADAPARVPGVVDLTAIACWGPARCLAAGLGSGAGVLVPVVNGSPGASTLVAGTSLLTGITCVFNHCLATGVASTGAPVVVTIARGSVTAVRPVSGVNALSRVSCGLLTGCLATGYVEDPANPSVTTGVLVPLGWGNPGSPRPVPGTANLSGISCLLRCQAVGAAEAATSFEGVTIGVGPGAPPLASAPATRALTRVSCSWLTSCLAIGDGTTAPAVIVPISRGTPGAAQPVAGASLLNDVACAGATCIAVGFQGALGGPAGVFTVTSAPS